MNIFKRIKNLWILSGLDLTDSILATLRSFLPNRKAKIISLEEPLDILK